MSINVTVNGKPISLSKIGAGEGGRMVQVEPDTEFNRRRKIRLQQVRQQSKEIAADVRNRVKQEKSKQLTNIEHQNEKELRKNQEKKLQILQKQYEECNREIGAAHKNAALEKDPTEILNELSKKNDKSAHARLKTAIEQKQKEQAQHKEKQDLLEKQRKYTKEIEKTRANLVVGISKQQTPTKKSKKRKKKSKTNLNHSDIENISSSSPTFTPIKVKKTSPVTVPKQKKIIFNKIREQPQKEDKCTSCSEKSKSSDLDFICDNETCPYYSASAHDKVILQPESPPETPTKCISPFSSCSSVSVSKELSRDEIKKLLNERRPSHPSEVLSTKISDRIRQRSEQLIQPINEFEAEFITEPRKLQMKVIPIVDIPGVSKNLPYVPKTTLKSKITIPIVDIPGVSKNLPYVPKTTLKSKISITPTPQPQPQKSKYYIPAASVQKLDKTCVEVDSSHESQESHDLENYRKNMETQDQRAKLRGEKALKRAQIQQDYKQLMEELPVLQRQERLAAMRNHNPEFHMTDERLHELERRRQNRIENIFEKYYHKSKVLETPIITIRPVQKPIPDEDMKLPFTTLDLSEDLLHNIPQWKTESSTRTQTNTKSQQTMRKNSGIHFADTQATSEEILDENCRQRCLAELLQRLNKQRELLLQEVQNLPPSSNLQRILHDDTLMNITGTTSRSRKAKFVSASTSPITTDLSEPSKFSKTSKKDKIKKRVGTGTSSDSCEEKQKKRLKHKEHKEKKNKMVVRNDEGTQTSPPVRDKPTPALKPKKQEEDDKLCEIIIKMCDDSKVKICTQPVVNDVLPPQKLHKNEVLPPQKLLKNKNEVLPPQKLINDISSSTSYLSPPILSIPNPNGRYADYKDTLFGKPKQTNIDTLPKHTDHIKHHSITKQKQKQSKNKTKIINPQLLNYIKKLLSMSRKSIDDLTVSSISEVSSPSPQIIASEHNNPFIQLQNVMNYYNLSFADIHNHLSTSSAASDKNASDKNASDKNASDKNKSDTNAEMEQLDVPDSSPTSDDVDYSEILSKYQEVTRTCVNKISTLTLMIDKIRAEKDNILSPVSVDFNENSVTSYLELPPQQKTQNCTCTSPLSPLSPLSGDSNKSYSLTQEEIDKYFLEIGPPLKKDQTDNISKQEPFIPMLKGIPKYSNGPIVNLIPTIPTIPTISTKPRPPASLTQNVNRYNLNIDMTPHELSTIVELDTVCTTSKNLSEKRPKSPPELIPNRDSDSTSTSGFITISPEHGNTSERKPRSKLLSSISENSSTSPENFEDMLRNMGLGWAISTLKKTQEALALSSSSSSDSSLRKHVSLNNTSTTSDVTLKDVLNREFLKKLSASSSSSDSPNLQDISDIAGGKDRSITQRTSTPVLQQQSKSTNLFASVSDISSVRQHSHSHSHSDENLFLSIPDISLDTNRSLK